MIPFIIQVDPDEVLADYGAGAVVRIQSGALEAGPFADLVPAPTVAIVSGTSEYRIVDAAGTSATWYRTRYENVGGTSVSDWSDPRLGAERPIYLSLEDLKLLIATTLDDEALLILLDAAKSEIIRYAGPGGDVTEMLSGPGDLLALSAPAESITGIVADDVTLDTTDYRVLSPTLLLRLATGTNPAYAWGHHVFVTYVTEDDSALRQRVQADLVRHAIASTPGAGALASQKIGTWEETYATSSSTTYTQTREDILSTLSTGMLIR